MHTTDNTANVYRFLRSRQALQLAHSCRYNIVILISCWNSHYLFDNSKPFHLEEAFFRGFYISHCIVGVLKVGAEQFSI